MKRFTLRLVLFALQGQLVGCQVTDHRGTATVCEVHGVNLLDDVVPCEAGFFDYAMSYYDARRTLFPNANDKIEGPMWGSRVRVRYCPECREAKKAWERQQKP